MKKNSGKGQKTGFSGLLLSWNRKNNTRQMPWKGEKDPYKIWLSEIILQQTRVDQGLGYYNKFIKTFPDIYKLAKAPEEKVFKLWEGLGYYSRCKNLLHTAKYISNDLAGRFPDTYESIKTLKGVGPYTAAAISSFAFNLPHAVVDGNVFRVLARVFGIDKPVDSSGGKKHFTALANELLVKKQPGFYNQAIMDFGAMICKPAPLCGQCVFNKSCYALLNNKVNELPVKTKKINIRKRWFYYLVMEYRNKVLLRQRVEKDIWQGLYEFPLIEAESDLLSKKVLQKAEKELLLKKEYEIVSVSPVYKQQLSHQLILGNFIHIQVKKKPPTQKKWIWTEKNKLKKYAFPKIINHFLSKQA